MESGHDDDNGDDERENKRILSLSRNPSPVTQIKGERNLTELLLNYNNNKIRNIRKVRHVNCGLFFVYH